jgi:transposase
LKAARIDPDDWYTVDEVAKFFSVKPATVRQWLRKGDFINGEKHTYGLGRRTRWEVKGKEIKRVLPELSP